MARSLTVLLLCSTVARADAEHIRTLVSLLDSAEPETRIHAAKRIGEYGPRAASAAPALVEVLGDLLDLDVRAAARDALIAIGPKAIPALLKGLRHKNPRVVSGCVLILSMHEQLLHKHRKALGKALAGGRRACDRIVDLLVGLGPDGVEPLIFALKKGEPRAQFAAARGLARLGEPGKAAVFALVETPAGVLALRAFPADVALPRIENLEMEVNVYVVAGLTGHGEKAVPLLLAAGSALEGKVDIAELRRHIVGARLAVKAASALGGFKVDEREEVIASLVAGKKVRELILFALNEAPAARLARELTGWHAATAAAALAFNPEKSLPALREALTDAALRDGAARVLGVMGADAAPALPDLAKLDTEAAKTAHARIHELATLKNSDCKEAIADFRAKRRKPALAYFERAAAAGNPIAMHYLALMLARKDKKRSEVLLRDAARAGYIPSQVLLGDRHLAKEEWGKAERLYKDGAKKGDRIAQYKYAYAYTKKWKLGHKYVAKYVRGSAEQGYAPAQLALFNMLRRGKGVVQDYRAADRWLFEAADQGYPDALHQMHYHHLYGTKDYTEAYAWLKLAAERDPKQHRKRFSSFRKNVTNKQRVEGKKRATELATKIPVWRDS